MFERTPNEQTAHELAMIALAVKFSNIPELKGETNNEILSEYITKEYKENFMDFYFSIYKKLENG